MYRYIFWFFVTSLLWILSVESIFASPFYPSDYNFPTAIQSRNACYFTSINIALEAKYKTKLDMKKSLGLIGFSGKTLATWEYKKRFSDLTHVVIREYGNKRSAIQLLDAWEPVLISTQIIIGGKNILHVSVAYSYDTSGFWVSDPLDGKRKHIRWNEVFHANNTVRFNSLRTVSVKPYNRWSENSKTRESRENIWRDETKIRE